MPGPSPYIAKLRERNRRPRPQPNLAAPPHLTGRTFATERGESTQAARGVAPPPTSLPVTTATIGGTPRVTSYAGTPLRYRPSLSTFSSDPERFLTPSGELRKRYLGGRKRRKVGIEVPAFVPKNLRRTVALEGQRLNEALGEAESSKTGPEYLAALLDFESAGTWDPNVEGPPTRFGTAKGIAQALDSTRADIEQRFGINYDRPQGQVKLAALHASGKAGYGPLYGGYNPGYGADPIENRATGPNVTVRVPKRAVKRRADGAPPRPSDSPKRPLSIAELFHDPGVNIADGVGTAPVGGHGGHVHFASEKPRDVLRAARIAQKMGLSVRENPLFDDVDPVHTEGSHHYQERPLPPGLVELARKLGGQGGQIGEALDVSGGDSGTLLRYNQRLAQMGGGPVTPTGGGTYVPPSGGGGTAPGLAPLGESPALVARQERQESAQSAPRADPLVFALSARAARPQGLNEEEEEEDIYDLLFRPRRR